MLSRVSHPISRDPPRCILVEWTPTVAHPRG